MDNPPLHMMKSYEAAVAGIGLVPEDRCIIPGETVDEIEKPLNIIKGQGITTVIVKQNVVRALNLSDRAVILDTGGIVFDGSPDEILNDEALRAEYLAI